MHSRAAICFFHKNGKSGLFWTFVKITFQCLQYKGIDYTVRIENRTEGIPTTANHAKTILTVGKNKIWRNEKEENSDSNSSNQYQSVHDIFSSSCTCVMCFCCLFYIVFKATYTKQCPCVCACTFCLISFESFVHVCASKDWQFSVRFHVFCFEYKQNTNDYCHKSLDL